MGELRRLLNDLGFVDQYSQNRGSPPAQLQWLSYENPFHAVIDASFDFAMLLSTVIVAYGPTGRAKAEGIRVKSQAQADATRAIGEAEAYAIRTITDAIAERINAETEAIRTEIERADGPKEVKDLLRQHLGIPAGSNPAALDALVRLWRRRSRW